MTTTGNGWSGRTGSVDPASETSQAEGLETTIPPVPGPSELTLARSGNVIELLEALLERARQGDIVSVAVAWEWIQKGGAYRCAHDVGSNAATLVGFLEVAKTAIVRRHLLPTE